MEESTGPTRKMDVEPKEEEEKVLEKETPTAPTKPKPRVAGVPLYFPEGKTPFPPQWAVMAKAMTAIRNSSNALLESPTGTGKTLSLLCSTLSWQRHNRQEKYEEELKRHADAFRVSREGVVESKDKASVQPSAKWIVSPPKSDSKVYFTSRTHSQLRQVSGELATCSELLEFDLEAPAGTPLALIPPTCRPKDADPYGVLDAPQTTHRVVLKMSILASRSRFCVNDEIRKKVSSGENAVSLEDACKEARDHRTCRYYPTSKALAITWRREGPLSWDIEDLVEAAQYGVSGKGKGGLKLGGHHGCPYFASREMAEDADLILCPYTYLIDPIIRNSLEINLSRAIVILDEAHNIESSCCEGASFSHSLAGMAEGAKQLLTIADRGAVIPNSSARRSRSRRRKDEESPNEPPPDQGALRGAAAELGNFLENLNRWIVGLGGRLTSRSGFSGSSSSSSASSAPASVIVRDAPLLEALESVGVTAERINGLTNALHTLSAVFKADELKLENEKEMDAGEVIPRRRGYPDRLTGSTLSLLERLLLVCGFIVQDDAQFAKEYRLLVRKLPFVPRRKRSKGPAEPPLEFVLMCLSPAVAFVETRSLARSVLLTSGTLSPMSGFSGELGVEFEVQLEAQHVVDASKQVCALVVPSGPRGRELRATFTNTKDPSFQDALGSTILSICRATPSGVLAFFPSYRLVEDLEKRWKATGLWEEIVRVKQVCIEPRRGSFDEVMETYRSAIERTGGKATIQEVEEDEDEEENDDAAIAHISRLGQSPDRRGLVDHARPTQTGALLLAVFRGKASEGIDFSDDAARAVVAVGIPYPSIGDDGVKLKKEHNQRLASQHRATAGPGSKIEILDGQTWYEQQAFRALNQALGRCIRHRNDYGAMLLVDCRHNSEKNNAQLSRWLRGIVRNDVPPSHLEPTLQSFFQAAQERFATSKSVPSSPPPTKSSSSAAAAAAAPEDTETEAKVEVSGSPPSFPYEQSSSSSEERYSCASCFTGVVTTAKAPQKVGMEGLPEDFGSEMISLSPPESESLSVREWTMPDVAKTSRRRRGSDGDLDPFTKRLRTICMDSARISSETFPSNAPLGFWNAADGLALAPLLCPSCSCAIGVRVLSSVPHGSFQDFLGCNLLAVNRITSHATEDRGTSKSPAKAAASMDFLFNSSIPSSDSEPAPSLASGSDTEPSKTRKPSSKKASSSSPLKKAGTKRRRKK